jgi:hypothetical protein
LVALPASLDGLVAYTEYQIGKAEHNQRLLSIAREPRSPPAANGTMIRTRNGCGLGHG